MKKNLLSILILVLLIVNIAMTAVMMISVTGTNQKTAELIQNIAMVMNLELYNPGGVPIADVPMSDTDFFNMSEIMVPLKLSTTVNADGTVTTGKQGYAMLTFVLSQDKRHEDYKTYGGTENLTARESVLQEAVIRVVGAHTMEECQNDMDSIVDELLAEVQRLFGSNFIFKIGVSGKKFGS